MNDYREKIKQFLWEKQLCKLMFNKTSREYELKLITDCFFEYPYLIRYFVCLIKYKLREQPIECIVSLDKKAIPFAAIISNELGLPLYLTPYQQKDKKALHLFFSTISGKNSTSDENALYIFDMCPIPKDTPIQSIFHVYELLEYGKDHCFLTDNQWEDLQTNYFKNIPFEKRQKYMKDIQNRHISMTRCYNLLFKKKSNLILDCVYCSALELIKIMETFHEFFFIVIVDSDNFDTFTKKHKELIKRISTEKHLLVYDYLRNTDLDDVLFKNRLSRKLKGNWSNGFILNECNQSHITLIRATNKELGILYDLKNMLPESYQIIQKNIENSIGIFCKTRREVWNNDSRIFYINKYGDHLNSITPKKITEKILFYNIDFLLLQVQSLGNSQKEVITKLKTIQNKSWKTFKNKL